MRKRLTVLGTAVLAALAALAVAPVAPTAAWATVSRDFPAVVASDRAGGANNQAVAGDDRLTDPITLGGSYTCRGERAVLADEDYYSATMGDDVIVALAEDVDTINLLDGDDLLCIHVKDSSSHAGVVVNAGNGDDTVVTYGGAYHDIFLDAGNDIAYLNGYDEGVWGGTGNDHMWGLGGDKVYLRGESGTDILQGSPAGEHLEGGDDGDLIIGADGSDVLDGDGGNDSIQGGAGFDIIDGGSGNADTCTDTFGVTTFIACETTVNAGPGGITT